MKKSQDQIIDQTLQGLRYTQPREGMEQRLLHALHNQPLPKPRFVWTWPLATATGAAVLLALLTTFHHHRTPANTASNSPSTPPTNLSSRPERSGVPEVRSLRGGVESAVERPASPQSQQALTKPQGIEAKPRRVEAPSTPTTEEARLLDDLHAPSQPSPPLPLTRQERLLLRAARKGDAIELAQLEPLREAALRAHAESSHRSAFVQYVESFLAPMAQAERLNPTPVAPEPEPQPDSTITEQDSDQP